MSGNEDKGGRQEFTSVREKLFAGQRARLTWSVTCMLASITNRTSWVLGAQGFLSENILGIGIS